MKKVLSIILHCCFFLMGCAPQTPALEPVEENPMVHADGMQLIGRDGSPVHLKGVIPEGWVQLNGVIWNAGFISESEIERKLTTIVGPDEYQKFIEGIQQNFITEKDLEMMAAMGFNAVRIPINHTLLEDDLTPYQYKDSGWALLDRLLDWCDKHKIYVILDLQSAPGGQSTFFTADPDNTNLWQSKENQARTIALWKAIASRYKDETIVAGYDLLNEPNLLVTFELINLYKQIISAVREVDPYHLIILEGAKLATDFRIFKEPLDYNMAYTFHSYHLIGEDKTAEHFENVSEVATSQNVPMLNSEFGAHNIDWINNKLDLFNDPESNVSGWIFWPWKRIPPNDPIRYRPFVTVETTPAWDELRFYLGGLGGAPSREKSLQAMNEFVENVKIENCVVDPEMAKALEVN